MSAELFLPDHQKKLSAELLNALNAAMVPFLDRTIDDKLKAEMVDAISITVRDWLRKYPVMSKINVGFELKTDKETGKIRILPSYDFQRLLIGSIIV